MRYAAYVVAVLVAAAIVVFLARDPSVGDAGAEVASSQPVEPTAVVTGEKTQLVMHVPNMHCPFACYPAVKETLEDQQGVAGIELVEQKEDGVIDNPRVILTVGENFDPAAALNALSQAGFSESAVEDARS